MLAARTSAFVIGTLPRIKTSSFIYNHHYIHIVFFCYLFWFQLMNSFLF
ncbi:precorrin-6Y C5,15-methyltransferase [Listeria monocytogenes]|nr:precorrin-6Y C5,15-methyltransferase [Listeria monocytogenes]GAT40845.1 precorrin-6Y C5,15-methyltransferase [Listeria monocytogenes]